MSSGAEVEPLLTTITAVLTSLIPNVSCSVRLIDEAAGGYRLVAASGAGIKRLAPIIPFGAGLSHAVAEARQPVLTSSATIPPSARTNEVGGRTATRYYGVPIRAGEKLVGVLNVAFMTEAAPTTDELNVIRLIAGQVALATCTGPLGEAPWRPQQRVTRALLIEATGLRSVVETLIGASEELNNALTVILGRMELVMRRVREPKLRQCLDLARRAALDGAQSVERGVKFAHAQRPRILAAPEAWRTTSTVVPLPIGDAARFTDVRRRKYRRSRGTDASRRGEKPALDHNHEPRSTA
jgi:signal transduction protein with GAF and PtsI domain